MYECIRQREATAVTAATAATTEVATVISGGCTLE